MLSLFFLYYSYAPSLLCARTQAHVPVHTIMHAICFACDFHCVNSERQSVVVISERQSVVVILCLLLLILRSTYFCGLGKFQKLDGEYLCRCTSHCASCSATLCLTSRTVLVASQSTAKVQSLSVFTNTRLARNSRSQELTCLACLHARIEAQARPYYSSAQHGLPRLTMAQSYSMCALHTRAAWKCREIHSRTL